MSSVLNMRFFLTFIFTIFLSGFFYKVSFGEVTKETAKEVLRTSFEENETDIKIEQKENRYHISVVSQLNAKIDTIYKLLTDYDNIHKLDPAIIKSRIVRKKAQIVQVETISYECVGPFCQEIKHTQDVQSFSRQIISAKTVPELSDYSYGYMLWHLKSLSEADFEQTLIKLTIELEPSFWLPPLIGSYVLEQKFSTGLEQFFKNLATHAAEYENTSY